MADGFLGRWSRRKLDAKEGRPLEPEPVREAEPDAPLPRPSSASGRESEGDVGTAPTPEPPPTLEDVRSLTADSDFSRFVRVDVSPDVKNAAFKKLFSDPHFNVMDGLDTYIDDYTKSDPIPESMLKQLTAGRFLGLFREDEEERKDETGAPQPRDVAEGQASESVAQSEPLAAEPAPASSPAVPPEPHAHPDLRLQQDDAARPGEAGRGTG